MSPVLLTIALLISACGAQSSGAGVEPIEYSCLQCPTNQNFTSNSSYAAALDTLLSTLVTNAPITGFYESSQALSGSQSSLTIHGMLQCRADNPRDSCDECARELASALRSRCSSSSGARMQLQGCVIWYENYSFVSQLDESLLCVSCSGNNASEQYNNNLLAALSELVEATSLTHDAVRGSGSSQVFSLAECRRDMSREQCRACLSAAVNNLTNLEFLEKSSGSILLNSCYIRFDTYKFYNSLGALQSGDNQRNQVLAIVFGILGGLLALGLIGFCLFRYRARLFSKYSREDIDLKASLHQGALIYSYQSLKDATQNFSAGNKLGEGGFGIVYKGTLKDGNQVAVKRLSAVSQQGRKAFVNEVNLVSGVQHRNLVKLYGCCVEESERILVYELLKNNSLSSVLFDKAQSCLLTWSQRFRICLGVARGLAYLHEESQLRIVHRDIKAANILLDEKFEAKIADFGLARLFSDDNSINTRITGTRGYMAPEYALHGHLTDKADVFSFGIVCLEIVSGRRNTDLEKPTGQEYVLEWAWKLHQKEAWSELLDPRVRDNTSDELREDDVCRVVLVGLLCAQATPQRRPSMSQAVSMLSGDAKIEEVLRPGRLELLDGGLFSTSTQQEVVFSSSISAR